MIDDTTKTDADGITIDEFTGYLDEMIQQPPWRARADKEMDYVDGNQLDSELLRKQQALGIPPAVENVIQPAVNAVMGFEAKTRKDWRATANGAIGGQDVADAINYKLNQAEKLAMADQACTDAFKPQYCVGIGWVEVARERDPFKFPYRCGAVHRNEIWWDMVGAAENPDFSGCRWLIRRKWMQAKTAALRFPAKKDLIEHAEGRWTGRFDMTMGASGGGGGSTGLSDAWASERGWSIEEQEWYDTTNKRVCLFEVWYRRWTMATLLKSPDGRIVEYDPKNQVHNVALAQGLTKVIKAPVCRVRQAYFMGPHLLHDGPSPYTHRHFGYVPFFGTKEDRTNVPIGSVKGMIFPQESLNSGISKLRWGMSAVRTERTKGAVAMTDEKFRQQVARVDADIVLDPGHMAQPGARFEVKRDFQLNEQQYRLLEDARLSIERASGITSGFLGREGTANSGLQEQTQVEQSTQALGAIMDNFSRARTMVGEILMSFIIEDLGDQQEVVVIEGDAVREDRTVVLNKPEIDPQTGMPYLSNDVQRSMLKVTLTDVPTSSSFRSQQLNTLGEAVKSMTPAMQAAVMPFMVGLMDMPYKREVVEAIREAAKQESPEAIEQRIQEAVKQALANAGNEHKARQLDIQERESDAKIRKLIAETVQTGVQSAFSAMQAGQVIATMPQVAPVADVVMQGAGYQRPNPMGVDPNFPQPQIQGVPVPSVHQNTSPGFPPVPGNGTSPMTGIETATPTDNLSGQAAFPAGGSVSPQ